MSYIVQIIGGLHTSTLTRFSTEQALELTALPGGIKSSEQAKVFLAALGLPLPAGPLSPDVDAEAGTP